jgi:hypothetical protein
VPYIQVWVDDDNPPLNLDKAEDDEIIEEIEKRGYQVYGKNRSTRIGKLYSTYTTMSPKFFEKELKKFFREHLDVDVR